MVEYLRSMVVHGGAYDCDIQAHSSGNSARHVPSPFYFASVLHSATALDRPRNSFGPGVKSNDLDFLRVVLLTPPLSPRSTTVCGSPCLAVATLLLCASVDCVQSHVRCSHVIAALRHFALSFPARLRLPCSMFNGKAKGWVVIRPESSGRHCGACGAGSLRIAGQSGGAGYGGRAVVADLHATVRVTVGSGLRALGRQSR